MAEMNAAKRFALIKENLQEILNPDIIEGILAEGRNPKIYWGTTQHFFFHAIYGQLLKSSFPIDRNESHWQTSLRILWYDVVLNAMESPSLTPQSSTRCQNRTVSGCRLRCDDPDC